MRNKILILIGLVILLFGSVFAVQTYDSIHNPDMLSKFSEKNPVEVSTFWYIIFSNTSFTLDREANYELPQKSFLFYNIHNNNNVTKTFVFVTIYREPNGNTTYAYGNFLNISAYGDASVIVEPTTPGELIETQIYCEDNKSETCGAGYQVFKHLYVYPTSSSYEKDNIFKPLIDSVVALIRINLSIWRIFFYLLIISLVIGAGYGIFKAAFYLLEKTKELNKKE